MSDSINSIYNCIFLTPSGFLLTSFASCDYYLYIFFFFLFIADALTLESVTPELSFQKEKTMYSLWRLAHTFNLLRRHFWSTLLRSLLVSCAIIVPIAIITAIAKIAYQEQSWEAFLVLTVTIIQVS